MTPRNNIEWLHLETSFSDFLSIYKNHPHSRFPVYDDDYDDDDEEEEFDDEEEFVKPKRKKTKRIKITKKTKPALVNNFVESEKQSIYLECTGELSEEEYL